MPLERKQLNTASLQATYTRHELPVSEKFGTGERYTFGTTHVDIYPLPPETTPLLFVRGRRNRLAVGDVYKVEPTDTNGLLHGFISAAYWFVVFVLVACSFVACFSVQCFSAAAFN